MAGKEPDCVRVLAQVEESMRAMKLHVITYQLRLLQLSLRKRVETTDTIARKIPETTSSSGRPRI